jgi:AcrR family transcriptional regulator
VALELVDKGGIESVSMRQVAQGLGVEAMSLYKHIANKDDLLDGLVELIFAQMTLPSPDLEWKAALRERAFSVRQALNRYPWAASLIETSGNLGPTRLRHHNTMIGILRKGGFTIELSYNILITFTSYIYGFVIMEQAWFAPPKEKKTDVKPPVISPDELPHILEMINFVSGKGSDATVRPQPGLVTEFEFGLNNLLEGFARVLPK